MRTKSIYLCLLFLFLGTTIAWADKYYMPGTHKTGTNPRLTLGEALGKKFMIYNTAINGSQDRTGFLRNDGNKFAHDKSKGRDLYVYNENFVYTLEAIDTDADGTADYYAIKSLSTGTYLDCNGNSFNSQPSDAKLSIKAWNDTTATGKSSVKMESWQYNVIESSSIVSGGHGTTVFVIKGLDNNTYWNGNTESFATWSDAHPYAFYEAHEVTSGEYLQDLHIYSRSDIYSAQVIYGLVQTESDITATSTVGTALNLIDGDNKTELAVAAGEGYQFYLGDEGASSVNIYLQRNADATNVPSTIKIEVSNDGSGWTQVGDAIDTGLSSNYYYASSSSSSIEFGATYKYIRISNGDTSAATSFSEVYILPVSNEVEDAINYITTANSADSPIYTKATAQVYTQTVEEYNQNFPDARLLSGVPLAGNKYRIYADAYDADNSVYVNKEIMAGDDALEIKAQGSYHGATEDEQAKYEWYCEQTTGGKLVFKNVADPTKYLGNGEIVSSPYEWSINTVLTQRYGVPLINNAQEYLAMYNDGSSWQASVDTVQNQTVVPAVLDLNDTPDDDSDDTTVACGLCTDFVFIPVTVDDTEKKITITAGDLVARNIQLTYDGSVYSLPFSRMFKESDELPKVQLLASTLHAYAGIKVNNGSTTEGGTTNSDGVISFDFSSFNNGDVLDIQLTITPPFDYTTDALDLTIEPTLYLIKNMRPQSIAQQSRPRRTNIDIGEGDSEDTPISTQSSNVYFAKFDSRNSNMSLVAGTSTVDFSNTTLDATSLFYFTATEDTATDEYYATSIKNVTTVMKCASDISWSKNGNTWYVQPHKTYSYEGYNIGATPLNATNNPADAWCSNHTDGDKIVAYNANDDGAAWQFVKVDAGDARTLLNNFIVAVHSELIDTLDKRKLEYATYGYDLEKINKYIAVVDELKNRAADYLDGTRTDYNATAKLLQYAENIHMLEHEIEYSLYALPDTTLEDKIGSDPYNHPHWYYIKNVNSNNYATYSTATTPMTLNACADGKQLANMFYFVGEKNTYPTDLNDMSNYRNVTGNNLIIDEYLKIHLHNFSAKKNTLVAQNKVLQDVDNPTIDTSSGSQVVMSGLDMKSDGSWCIEMEYDLDGKTQYNAYGTCLLTSSSNVLGDNFPNAFQVYFKDDRSIVIKVNNADDYYRFYHTQDYYSHIKVVITYSSQNVTLDVYNSLGEKESKIITGVTLKDFSTLYASLPDNGTSGVSVTNITVKEVEAMTWQEHDSSSEKDTWYVLPSSNEEQMGFAIVMDDAFDTNMGWTNELGAGTTIGNDLGNAVNSTWKFERITDFTDHIAQLLELWNLDDCTVYHAPLVELYEGILTAYNNGGVSEETFNQMYALINEYNGLGKDEYLEPKEGKLYTIRPANSINSGDALSASAENIIVNANVYGDVASVEPQGGVTYYICADVESTSKKLYLHNNSGTLEGTETYTADDASYMWTCIDNGDGTISFVDGNGNYIANNDKYHMTIGETPAVYTTPIDDDGYSLYNQASYTGGKFMVISTDGTAFDRNSGVLNNASWVSEFFFIPCDESTAIKEYDSHGVWFFEQSGDAWSKSALFLKSLHTQSYVDALTAAADDATTKLFDGDAQTAVSLEPIGSSVVSINVAGSYLTHSTTTSNINGGSEDVIEVDGVRDVKSPTTSWIIEEVADYEKVRFLTDISTSNGYNTLMLGFDAVIPDNLYAFYAHHYDMSAGQRYVSMQSYDGGIIPANTPVVVRIKDEDKTTWNTSSFGDIRFYYSATAASEEVEVLEDFMYGALYNTVVDCQSFDVDGDDHNVYMMQQSKSVGKWYWMYENRDENGDKVYVDADGNICESTAVGATTNHDKGGYVLCKANKCYAVMPKSDAGSIASFSIRFDDSTVTGIEDIEDDWRADEQQTAGEGDAIINGIYDLQGRKLNAITAPGMYIVNGKKIIVK